MWRCKELLLLHWTRSKRPEAPDSLPWWKTVAWKTLFTLTYHIGTCSLEGIWEVENQSPVWGCVQAHGFILWSTKALSLSVSWLILKLWCCIVTLSAGSWSNSRIWGRRKMETYALQVPGPSHVICPLSLTQPLIVPDSGLEGWDQLSVIKTDPAFWGFWWSRRDKQKAKVHTDTERKLKERIRRKITTGETKPAHCRAVLDR